MASAPFSTAAFAHSQSPAGASNSGGRKAGSRALEDSRGDPTNAPGVLELLFIRNLEHKPDWTWKQNLSQHHSIIQRSVVTVSLRRLLQWFSDDRVSLCPIGIRCRIIQVVMQSTALGALQGAGNDDLRDSGNVA